MPVFEVRAIGVDGPLPTFLWGRWRIDTNRFLALALALALARPRSGRQALLTCPRSRLTIAACR
jgi:hypothetical protein